MVATEHSHTWWHDRVLINRFAGKQQKKDCPTAGFYVADYFDTTKSTPLPLPKFGPPMGIKQIDSNRF